MNINDKEIKIDDETNTLENEDFDESTNINEKNPPDTNVKKKKKKKKKKKSSTSKPDESSIVRSDEEKEPIISQGPPTFGVKGLDEIKLCSPGQTSPPSIPVSTLFPNKNYSIGEIENYTTLQHQYRSSDQELKLLEDMNSEIMTHIRYAAEVHRQVRFDAQRYIKPGLSMIDIVDHIEQTTHKLFQKDLSNPSEYPYHFNLKRGLAFPVGVSLNNCAAHYTPNSGDKTILSVDDVLKVDIGTHSNGYIVDSAFSLCWNDQYLPLLEAVQAATNEGVKHSGIDSIISEIGASIQEVMESYEVEIKGKIYPIKSIQNLTGHSLGQYIIHAGKSVPIVKSGDHGRMQENEFYAIETFGSTGRGRVVDNGETSHYMMESSSGHLLRTGKSKHLLHVIEENFGTLAFCRRWIDKLGEEKYLLALKNLIDSNLVRPYPPLCDIKGSYVAQYEHTLFLRPTCKEVLSRGLDY